LISEGSAESDFDTKSTHWLYFQFWNWD
jgi:hypothetical protein